MPTPERKVIFTPEMLQDMEGSSIIEYGPKTAWLEENGVQKVYTTYILGYRGLEPLTPTQGHPLVWLDAAYAISHFTRWWTNFIMGSQRVVLRMGPTLVTNDMYDVFGSPRTEYQIMMRAYLEARKPNAC